MAEVQDWEVECGADDAVLKQMDKGPVLRDSWPSQGRLVRGDKSAGK